MMMDFFTCVLLVLLSIDIINYSLLMIEILMGLLLKLFDDLLLDDILTVVRHYIILIYFIDCLFWRI